MKRAIALFIILSMLLFAKDYRKNSEAISVMNTLVKKYDFKKEDLEKLFLNVKVQKSALHAFLPPKKLKTIVPTIFRNKLQKQKHTMPNMVHGNDILEIN